jgi:hypothetical protein
MILYGIYNYLPFIGLIRIINSIGTLSLIALMSPFLFFVVAIFSDPFGNEQAINIEWSSIC